MVTDIVPIGKFSKMDVLKLSASLEKGSEHSLADAIVKKAEEEKVDMQAVSKFRAVAGHGVEGNNRQ